METECLPYKRDPHKKGSKLVKAAIYVYMVDKVYTNIRHWLVLRHLKDNDVVPRVTAADTQGFVDSDGNFYSREEGLPIAMQENNVTKENMWNTSVLISEDLWDNEGNHYGPHDSPR